MDAHELAIAALNEVAKPSSHRRDNAGKIASWRLSPNDAGSYITNSSIDDNSALTQQLSQSMAGSSEIVTGIAGSQESAIQSISSSNNSQSTTDAHDSPPTSTSDGFSSQNTSQGSQLSQLPQLATFQDVSKEADVARPSAGIPLSAGHKRTADGLVKPPSPDIIQQPRARGHTRTTSAVSNVSSVASSRIGELSSELRTRLSYAMVKVNNGWQSNSIEEVESLASQAGSPTSSTSTPHGRRTFLTSPREAIASLQGQSNASANSAVQPPTADFDLYSRTEPQSGTYESFWRSHSATIPARSSHIAHPSLAPPADIRPQPTSRRSHTPKFSKPPSLSGHGSGSMPHTPNRGILQTPQQKTIQEQDAIETLLFMSSPGNTGNMSHQFPPRASQNSPHVSPLRTEFTAPRGAPLGRRRGGSERLALERRSKIGAGSEVNRKGDAIDKLLDEMGDSSSDEEEIPLRPNYSSPRTRVAAGRV